MGGKRKRKGHGCEGKEKKRVSREIQKGYGERDRTEGEDMGRKKRRK